MPVAAAAVAVHAGNLQFLAGVLGDVGDGDARGDLRGTLGGITLNQTGRAVECIAIIMAVSVLSLGFRAGAIVALSIPLTPMNAVVLGAAFIVNCVLWCSLTNTPS